MHQNYSNHRFRTLLTILSTLTLIISAPQSAHAGDPETTCFESTPIGFNNTLENPIYFTIIDDIAYVIDDHQRLVIINLDAVGFFPTIANIELQIPIDDRPSITLSEDRTALYISDARGIHIYEISDLTDPWFVRHFPLSGNSGTNPTKGGRLFVGSYTTLGNERPLALRFITIDNSTLIFDGDPLFIIDNILYTSKSRTYDITDPTNPIAYKWRSAESSVNGNSYYINEDLLYSLHNQELSVININDPEVTYNVSTTQLDLPEDPTTFTMKNSIAFFANDHITAYDMSNPSDPTFLAEYRGFNGQNNVADMTNINDTFYTIDAQGNLTAFTLTSNPLATFATNSEVFEVKILNDPNNPTPSNLDLALATSANWGLSIYDITEPNDAKQISEIRTGVNFTRAKAIDSTPSTAFVAAEFEGLIMVDITDPFNPTQLSIYDPGGSTEDVQVNGNYAYVANQAHGLLILDVSDPSNPIVVSTTDTEGNGEDIALHQHHTPGMTQTLALLTSTSSSLPSSIIDVTNPFSPTILATIPAPTLEGAQTVTMSMQNEFIYTADGNSYRVFDASDLSNPFLVTTLTTDLPETKDFPGVSGKPIQIQFGPGNTLIVANGTAGLTYYNNTEVTNPVLDHYRLMSTTPDTTTELYRFEIHENLLFTATRGGGFRIYDLYDCQTPCPLDLNADGSLNFFDLSIYLEAFNHQDPLADLNTDGMYNFFDVSILFNYFTQGCP
tara:strand:- start:9066 stop:11249 length:2184 start_codon:yes stop_codon:yes gene_type:complete